MAAFQRSTRTDTLLHVMEVRGRVLWRRVGKVGNKGRISSREFGTNGEAKRALDEEAATKIEEGYVLVSPSASVDEPLRVRDGNAPAPAIKSLPTELAKQLRQACTLAFASGDLDLQRTITLAIETATQPCISSLVQLRFAAKGLQASLRALWSGGQTHDSDADGFELIVTLAADGQRTELDALVEFDRVVDIAGPARTGRRALGSAFQHRLERSDAWQAFAPARVLACEVERRTEWDWGAVPDFLME